MDGLNCCSGIDGLCCEIEEMDSVEDLVGASLIGKCDAGGLEDGFFWFSCCCSRACLLDEFRMGLLVELIISDSNLLQALASSSRGLFRGMVSEGCI